jgi:hypothetical protein
MTVGMLEGYLSVVGDEDTDIAGMFSTRLTSAVAEGDVVFPVETTQGWSASGKLALGGVVYSYTGTTATTFTGITHVNNGAVINGAYQIHHVAAEVTDLNRNRNMLDLARREMLVNYASGDYLSAIGRNLGVLRLPFVNEDDRFRKIIKALAYNPRGTRYGLELALDGLVDAGNYEIFEDLINFPCTVFIRLTGNATTDDSKDGKYG